MRKASADLIFCNFLLEILKMETAASVLPLK